MRDEPATPALQRTLGARLPGLAGGLLRRFPDCVAVALLATGLALAGIHDGIPPPWQDLALAAALWCAAAGPLLAGLRMVAEGCGWPAARHAVIAIAAAALLALWAWTTREPGFERWLADFRFLLVAAALTWALLLAPGLAAAGAASRAGRTQAAPATAFWHGVRRALAMLAVAAVTVLVLAAGLSAALLGLDALLGLPVPETAHADLWLLAGVLLLPCLWLALLPAGAPDPAPPGRALAVAIDLVLVPLALLYLAILYAYLALALLRWALPDGTTAGLVAAYAVAGTAIWLIAAAPDHPGRRHVRLFRRLFFPAMLPPLAMMGVALQTRIAAYGVTEPRYLLVLLAIWILGAALAQLLPRPAFSTARLAAVPALLCLLLALASYGPWSAGAVAEASQVARLQAALAEAGLLRDGRAATPDKAPSFATRKRLSGHLDTLFDSGRLAAVNRWLPAADALPPDAGAAIAAGALGFAYAERWQEADASREVAMWGGNLQPMSVDGYDSLWPFDLNVSADGLPGSAALLRGGRRHRLFIEAAPPALLLTDGDGRRIRFPLATLIERLDRSDGPADRPHVATAADDGLRARLVLQRLDARIGEDGAELVRAEGMILLAPAAMAPPER